MFKHNFSSSNKCLKKKKINLKKKKKPEEPPQGGAQGRVRVSRSASTALVRVVIANLFRNLSINIINLDCL